MDPKPPRRGDDSMTGANDAATTGGDVSMASKDAMSIDTQRRKSDEAEGKSEMDEAIASAIAAADQRNDAKFGVLNEQFGEMKKELGDVKKQLNTIADNVQNLANRR